jgi:hypothetical protein
VSPRAGGQFDERHHPEDSMAYAEKRGRSAKPWRVKYKLPSGIETSESGFETKAAALT